MDGSRVPCPASLTDRARRSPPFRASPASSGGLVDDEEVAILVDNRERQVLGSDAGADGECIAYGIAIVQHSARGDDGRAVYGECAAVLDALPETRGDAAYAHQICLRRTCIALRQDDDMPCHSPCFCSCPRSARMMRKEIERMMAMTVASDMPRSVTVPMVRLAVETPTPMTMEVRRRFLGLL